MLAISRALLARPKLMLLDEPSLGLSPHLVKEIFNIVRASIASAASRSCWSSRTPTWRCRPRDYGYVLEVGRIVMADTCARLPQKEDIKEFYLGVKEDGARGKRRWKKRHESVAMRDWR